MCMYMQYMYLLEYKLECLFFINDFLTQRLNESGVYSNPII